MFDLATMVMICNPRGRFTVVSGGPPLFHVKKNVVPVKKGEQSEILLYSLMEGLYGKKCIEQINKMNLQKPRK